MIRITKEAYSEDMDSLIITGKGGCGKSMALIFYPTIFNMYIEPFLFSSDFSEVSQHKDFEKLGHLSKAFYISITEQLNSTYVFNCLNQQIPKGYRLNPSSEIIDYSFLE